MYDFISVLLVMFQNLFSRLHFSSPLKKIKITDLPSEKIGRYAKTQIALPWYMAVNFLRYHFSRYDEMKLVYFVQSFVTF